MQDSNHSTPPRDSTAGPAQKAPPTEYVMVLEGGGQLEFGFLGTLGRSHPGVGSFWPSGALKCF